MIYFLKRLLYALRYAWIGAKTGWRAHKAIHDLACHYRISPDAQYTAMAAPLTTTYLHDAMAKLAIADPPSSDATKEDQEVQEWLNGD